MDLADFERSPGFLMRGADMLRNHGFAGILKNERIFGTLYRHVKKSWFCGILVKWMDFLDVVGTC